MTYLASIKTLLASTALVVAGSAASASTIYYSTFVTGDDLGTASQATLIATQNGTSVDFSLENTANSIASAFISAISFTYGGTLPTTATMLAGSQAFIESTLCTNGCGLNGGGFSFDVAVGIGGTGQNMDRLLVSEIALFSIAAVDLTLFDFSPLNSGIHIQGLNGGTSVKYTTGENCSPLVGVPCDPPVTGVPLPAGLPLLFAALGSIGILARRKKAA